MLDYLRRLSDAQLGRPVCGVLLSEKALLVMRATFTRAQLDGDNETFVTGDIDVCLQPGPRGKLCRPIQAAQWLVWFFQQAAGSKLETCGCAQLKQVILQKPAGSSDPTTIIYTAAYPQAGAGAGAGAGVDADADADAHRVVAGARFDKCIVKQVKDVDRYNVEKAVLLLLQEKLPANTDCVQFLAADDAKQRLAVTPHGKPYDGALFTTEHVAHVLTTLKAVHDAGVVWGDVRPANIVQSNFKPVIIDFGYGCRVDHVEDDDDYRIASPKFMHWRAREGNSADVLKQRDLDGIIALWLWCSSRAVRQALNDNEVVTQDMEDLLGAKHPLIPSVRTAKTAADELNYDALKKLILVD